MVYHHPEVHGIPLKLDLNICCLEPTSVLGICVQLSSGSPKAVRAAWNLPFSWWNSESLLECLAKKNTAKHCDFETLVIKVISCGIREWSPILMARSKKSPKSLLKTIPVIPLTYLDLPLLSPYHLNGGELMSPWSPCLTNMIIYIISNWCLFNGRFQNFVNYGFSFCSSNFSPSLIHKQLLWSEKKQVPLSNCLLVPEGHCWDTTGTLHSVGDGWRSWRWLTLTYEFESVKDSALQDVVKINSYWICNWSGWITIQLCGTIRLN